MGLKRRHYTMYSKMPKIITHLPSEIMGKIMLYNSHPVADIMKRFYVEIDLQTRPLFAYLRYHGFLPLTSYGSNGRSIHIDFHNYLLK